MTQGWGANRVCSENAIKFRDDLQSTSSGLLEILICSPLERLEHIYHLPIHLVPSFISTPITSLKLISGRFRIISFWSTSVQCYQFYFFTTLIAIQSFAPWSFLPPLSEHVNSLVSILSTIYFTSLSGLTCCSFYLEMSLETPVFWVVWSSLFTHFLS